MEFSIIFTSAGNRAVNHRLEEITGMKELDRMREYMKTYGLTVVGVLKEIPGYQGNVRVQISEAYARKSERFNEKSHIQVQVPEGAINCFYQKRYHFNSVGLGHGEVRCGCQRMLDENLLLENWKKAGYPIEWGISTMPVNR